MYILYTHTHARIRIHTHIHTHIRPHATLFLLSISFFLSLYYFLSLYALFSLLFSLFPISFLPSLFTLSFSLLYFFISLFLLYSTTLFTLFLFVVWVFKYHGNYLTTYKGGPIARQTHPPKQTTAILTHKNRSKNDFIYYLDKILDRDIFARFRHKRTRKKASGIL